MAYGKISPVLHTTSGVRQGDSAYLFLFNYVIDAIMEVVYGEIRWTHWTENISTS